MNQFLTSFLYAWAISSTIAKYLVIFFAKYVVYITAVVVLYWAWMRRKDLWHTILLFAPAGGNYLVLAQLIRMVVYSPRPFITDHLAPLVFVSPREWYTSFPSDHTIFLFSLATSVWFENKKAGTALFVLAAVVGIARIAAGVHWSSDILGGAILGVAFSIPEILILRKRFPSKHLTR